MSRPRSAQELVHWLEVGAGARLIKLAATLAGVIALSWLVAWKQFHGATSEATLLQADVGRQLVRGEGFTTLVNFPQTAAVLAARGHRFDGARAYPELHQPPLYPLVIAGALKLVPAAQREALWSTPPVPPDGFAGDYFLLGLNVVLLWAAAWLTYDLGRKLFEPRVGWLAALALLLSTPVWQATVAINGTALALVLAVAAFRLWWSADVAVEERRTRAANGWLAGVGGVGGLLFLTEYPAGVLAAVAAGYAAWRGRGVQRWLGAAAVAAGFAVVAAPWIVRNVALTGHPVGLAAQDVALKAGDPTAEPALVRAMLAAEPPAIELRKLGNKLLTNLQDNLKARLWSGGAMWFAAFFVAGWLYPFRAPVTNRLRWVCTGTLGLLLVAQGALNSGDTERPVAVWVSPLLMVFGAGFFFVLLGSNARLAAWPRLAMAALLGAQALPLAHDALEPRRLHFQYPPYFPALFHGVKVELARRDPAGKFGIMADVPAGLAWYGGARAWAQPPRLRDFYAITLEQPIGELVLTPRTLDRPFFSELNARPILPGSLAAVPNRFGEWGEIYAGLLVGTMPREFPLGSPHKVAENLFVLLNPALPPPRGK